MKLSKEEVDLPVTVEDFKNAIMKCKKSVQSDDLVKYEQWMRDFGSA